jgi:hypothetical protein
MKLSSIITLGLVNGVISLVLFACAALGLAVLNGNGNTVAASPMIFTVILTMVGPAIIVFDLVAALIGGLAKKNAHSSQLVAMIVAGCLGLMFAGYGRGGLGQAGQITLTQLALIVALMLPWAAGAGILKAFRKPA